MRGDDELSRDCRRHEATRREARQGALWARNHGYVQDNGMAILDLDSGGPARILA